MKASEILRKFADIVDMANNDSHPEGKLIHINTPDMSANQQEVELDPDPKMIPPLQQKLELLKKSVGVESEYDEHDCGCEDECECDEAEPEDELDVIRRIAGIHMIAGGEIG